MIKLRPIPRQEIADAVKLLHFSMEVLIVQKVDQLRLQQTEMQSKLCDFVEKLDLDNLDRFVESDISAFRNRKTAGVNPDCLSRTELMTPLLRR